MSNAWRGVLAFTAFLACPCYLPLTLPLVLGVLGGTGLGSIIAANTDLIYEVFTGYFVVGVGVGMFLMNREKRAGGDAACALPPKTAPKPSRGKRRVSAGRRHAGA